MTTASLIGATVKTDVPLKRRLKRAERARQLKALALVIPLLLFLLFTFAGPIAGMLWRAVDDREVRQVLPQTIAALASWDGKDLPTAPDNIKNAVEINVGFWLENIDRLTERFNKWAAR